MGNDEQFGRKEIPFGAETPAEEMTSADALTTFVESEALQLLAALVIAGFLIFQFARWYLANSRTVAHEDSAALRDRPANAVPAAQMPAEKNRRPWASKAEETAD